VCLGEATKVARFITDGDKAYDATVRLGVETDTQDAQGRTVAERPVPELTFDAVDAALARFRGTFEQTPPMFSAVKVGGRRLYELARNGEEVERAARSVTVHTLTLRSFSAPLLELSLRCSKGFFVRTLAHELGQALGCGAHLAALRRTQSGVFTLSHAMPLDGWVALSEGPGGGEAAARRLVPLSEALADMPAEAVSQAQAERITHGVPVEVSARGRVKLVGPTGRLLAIAEAQPGQLRYLRVLGA
jgi:tRNA pseudouridine55 synthase